MRINLSICQASLIKSCSPSTASVPWAVTAASCVLLTVTVLAMLAAIVFFCCRRASKSPCHPLPSPAALTHTNLSDKQIQKSNIESEENVWWQKNSSVEVNDLGSKNLAFSAIENSPSGALHLQATRVPPGSFYDPCLSSLDQRNLPKMMPKVQNAHVRRNIDCSDYLKHNNFHKDLNFSEENLNSIENNDHDSFSINEFVVQFLRSMFVCFFSCTYELQWVSDVL